MGERDASKPGGTSRHANRADLARALRLSLQVHGLLVLGRLLASAIGPRLAEGIAFSAATLCVGASLRGHPVVGATGAARHVAGPRVLAGLLAGVVGYASLVWLTLIVGRSAGLASSTAVSIAGAPTLADVVCRLLLAPCFEEGLYRGTLLPALAARRACGLPFGAAAAPVDAGRPPDAFLRGLRRALEVGSAIALTSALFALPHPTAWQRLGALLAGLLLGGVRLAPGGSLSLCLGLHAGFNLAALLPCTASCLEPPLVQTTAAGVLIALALRCGRER